MTFVVFIGYNHSYYNKCFYDNYKILHGYLKSLI